MEITVQNIRFMVTAMRTRNLALLRISNRGGWDGHVASIVDFIQRSGKKAGRKETIWKMEVLLEWILKKYDGRVWTAFIWLRKGTNRLL
jgi:hypothetical protein